MRMPDTVPMHAWREAMHDGVWDALPASCPVTHVLDVGANVGYFAVWARMRWPKAAILAVEPDAANFDCLSENVYGLDISVVRAGLGSGDFLALTQPGWCCSTRLYTASSAAGGVPSFRLNTLVDVAVSAAEKPILLCKIDCEGAERTLLDNPQESLEALQRCAALAIEFHHGSLRAVGPWLQRSLAQSHRVRWPRHACQIYVRSELCLRDRRFRRRSHARPQAQ